MNSLITFKDGIGFADEEMQKLFDRPGLDVENSVQLSADSLTIIICFAMKAPHLSKTGRLQKKDISGE